MVFRLKRTSWVWYKRTETPCNFFYKTKQKKFFKNAADKQDPGKFSSLGISCNTMVRDIKMCHTPVVDISKCLGLANYW